MYLRDVILIAALLAGVFCPALAQPAPEALLAEAADEASLPEAPAPQPAPEVSKRILGLAPAYKTVDPGENSPPPSPRQALAVATHNAFDYSSFVFVGLLSAMGEGYGTHPDLGKGLYGYGQYYWRAFLDKADGDYWTLFLMPALLREDGRYYIRGKGPKAQHVLYAMSRIFVSKTYQGEPTLNDAELLGKGAAQAISLAYYPSSDQTADAFAKKYGLVLGRDALVNAFYEFWPDMRRRLHRRRQP